MQDKSIVSSSVTRVFKVTDRIGVLFTGLVRNYYQINKLYSRCKESIGENETDCR